MVNGLSVTADQIEPGRANVTLCGQHRFRVELTQQEIQPREIRYASAVCIHRLQHRFAHNARILEVVVPEQLKAQVEAAAEHAHQRHVHTVSGCSAHHTSNHHARISATILEKSFTI